MVERLALRVFKQQYGLAALADETKRPHRPRVVQRISQFVFVSKSVEDSLRGMLGGGNDGQHSRIIAGCAPLSPPDHALSVLPQDPETVVPVGGKLRNIAQMRNSGVACTY